MKYTSNFRGIQLDLARQMETIDKIKEFIDFIAINGYNSLLLYLEWRVKTKSLTCVPDNESYSPSQIREIICYAESKDIEIIPGLACLGHAENILKYPEFANMAELRDGRVGRFGTAKQVFCLSQARTWNFIENYLTEICEIFPAQYIHIGLDEAWDIGYCDKCAIKAKTFRGEQELFLKVINFCHSIITQKFKRRVMMWDDMFEYYRDILPEVPRDIIMVCWQYQNDVRFIKGHFSNLSHKQTLNDFNKLGFDTVIAPADYSTANIRTFYNFAKQHNPMGMLVSSWEKKNCFRVKSFPVIAYGGRIGKRSQDDDEMFAEVIDNIFGSDDKLLVQAIHNFSEHNLMKEGVITIDNILSMPYKGLDNGREKYLEMFYTVLQGLREKATLNLGKTIINDIMQTIKFHILKFRLKRLTIAMFDPELDCPDAESEIEYLLAGFIQLKKQRVSEWNVHREGIEPNIYEIIYQSAIDFITELPALVQNNGVLKIRFCLPDQYSAEKCTISLKYADKWQEIKSGYFKYLDGEDAFWETFIPIDNEIEPEAIRLTATGFGGQGLAYVEAYCKKGHYIPTSLVNYKGTIVDPEYVLDDDCKWCFIGEKDTTKAFRNRLLANEIHSVEYNLKKVNGFNN